jgi:hypothetical protein
MLRTAPLAIARANSRQYRSAIGLPQPARAATTVGSRRKPGIARTVLLSLRTGGFSMLNRFVRPVLLCIDLPLSTAEDRS